MSLVNLNLNLNLDRTANKIAFCSAVVAGTIYVGYSVVKTAFSRRGRPRPRRGYLDGDDEDDFSPGGRGVFLRRLSQTTQTDSLLGELDLDFGGSSASGLPQQRIILRPKTVQERIRELNVRARQFADAVTSIQGSASPVPRLPNGGMTGRSLQVTPWGSPRMLSPIDIRPIVPEDSGEVEYPTRFSPSGSPSRHRRWHRVGSFKSTRKPVQVDFELPEDSRLKECERMWAEEREAILRNLPDLLSNTSGRELTDFEALQLVSTALGCSDPALVAEALSAATNYAAFRSNQDRLRQAGLVAALPKILVQGNRAVRQKACGVAANMALNESNQSEMRFLAACLAQLLLATPQSDPALMASTLSALTNVAVLPTWHGEMKPALHRAFSLLDEGHWNSDGISLQSLKLLINLSCNDEMIPSLLAAQAPSRLVYFLDPSMPDDVLLRVTTLLANLASGAKRQRIRPDLDLPAEDKAAAPDTMYAALFGLSMVDRYRRKALALSEHQAGHPDLPAQAQRLYAALSAD